MPGSSDDESGQSKRPQGASELPWRPAFRLEDFEGDTTVATSLRCTKKGEGTPADKTTAGARGINSEGKSI
jgi:hypothetical protein